MRSDNTTAAHDEGDLEHATPDSDHNEEVYHLIDELRLEFGDNQKQTPAKCQQVHDRATVSLLADLFDTCQLIIIIFSLKKSKLVCG